VAESGFTAGGVATVELARPPATRGPRRQPGRHTQPATHSETPRTTKRPGRKAPATQRRRPDGYFFVVFVVVVLVVVGATGFVTSVALYSTRVPG
jgi:hypothetical protein